MRKILGWVVLTLGAFLLVAGLVANYWAPDVVKRTPLDVDSTTRLEGTATKLNPATGELEDLDVKATSVTQVDSEASSEDTVVFVNTTCLVVDEGDVPDCVNAKDPQKRLINASSDVFATDRVTAEAVATDAVPADAAKHEGLVNKFPFDVQRTGYEYWDGLLGEAVPATFDGTEDLHGLETYRFRVSVPRTEAEVVSGIDGFYTQEKTIWVEPRTGSIVNQEQSETRTTAEGDTLLELDLAFTEEQVEQGVADAKGSVDQLRLLTSTVPTVGIAGGIVALLIGLVLVVAGRRRA